MKTSSAKAKGRKLQQWFRNLLVEKLELDPEDSESRPMGSQGEDIILGTESRRLFPYSVECKTKKQLTCGMHTHKQKAIVVSTNLLL